VEKNSFILVFKKLPFVFISSLFLFFLIESGLANSSTFWRFCNRYSEPMLDDGIRLEAELRTMPEVDKAKKVFLAGSSQAREGLDIEYLNNRFENVLFYNLGASGAASGIDMFMITDKLLSKQPETIVYLTFVEGFYYDYNYGKLKRYFDPKVMPYFLEHIDSRTIFSHKGHLLDAFLGRISLFYKYRSSFGRIFSSALKDYLGMEKGDSVKRFAFRENKPRSYFMREIAKADKKRYLATSYTVLNQQLFKLTAKEIAAKGVRLIVLSGPTHPLISDCYEREIDIAYDSFFEKQAKELGFVYLSKEQLPVFTKDDFIDFTHLNKAGRIKLTGFFGDYFSND